VKAPKGYEKQRNDSLAGPGRATKKKRVNIPLTRLS
jgi:hypothetical protein